MDQPETSKQKQQYRSNLALAAVASQVGVVTIVIVLGSLIGGLLLDKQFETKPMFTLLLLIVSMPITVFLMIKIVKSATSRIQPVIKKEE